MAGDWIKMRADLLTHPKVVRMASALNADRLRVVGGLFAVWCLFDAHSVDGQLEGYTDEVLDSLVGFPGFAGGMRTIGWLEFQGDSLVTPRFDEHNGQSAKRRATEAQRKREERKTSAQDADKKRAREEKRREEKNSSLREEGAPANPGEACKAMKAVGIQSVSPSHPKLLALLEAGITIAELVDAATHAVQNSKPFAYALATAEGRRRDAATVALPAAGNKQQALEDQNAAVAARFLEGQNNVAH